ncbi:MAG TPA: endonuclease domain-containing protein [Rhodanobacteraceae bacterium]|nr:endonuclease domain-containing protein [Rhodanobacteraceae bacterium]
MKGQTNRNILGAHLQRELRNAPTDAERLLWSHLKSRQIEGCKFRRQHPYGDFILDFVCLERRIVVELDGSQHVDATTYDEKRSRFLQLAGFRVLRFWNNEVFGEMDGVLEVIRRELVACDENPSPPNPPLEGEG